MLGVLISPQTVVAAYKATGLRPARTFFFSEIEGDKCGNALGAVALASGAKKFDPHYFTRTYIEGMWSWAHSVFADDDDASNDGGRAADFAYGFDAAMRGDVPDGRMPRHPAWALGVECAHAVLADPELAAKVVR